MKKKTVLFMVIIVIFSLSACGSGNELEISNQVEEQTNLQSQTSTSNPDMTTLIIGMLRLDETEMMISSEQAKTMLPYWKILKSLMDSDTAAQEEILSLLDDIRSELSEAQLNFISEMEFDDSNIREVMEELGIEFGRGNGSQLPEGAERPEGGSFIPGQGGGGGGGIPGQGGAGGGVELSPEQQETREAMIAERSDSFDSSSPLVQAIITYLEAK